MEGWTSEWVSRRRALVVAEFEALPEDVQAEWVDRLRARLAERGAHPSVRKRLETHGLKPVETQAFERLATDMTSQVFKLKESKPDAVIVYALGQQAASFFKAAEKLGWNPVVFGAGGLNDPKFVELLDGKPVKLFIASYYESLDSANPAIRDFVSAYEKRYSSKPSALGVFFVPSRWSNVGSSSRCTASAPSASRPREHGTYLGDRTMKWRLDVASSDP